jgi:hypothetical protein
MKSNSKKPRRRVVGEKRRVNLKLDGELAEWAFSFADRHNTSVTQLIIDHFLGLRKQEGERMSQDAEQI